MFIFCSFILKESYIDKTRVGAFGKVRIVSVCACDCCANMFLECPLGNQTGSHTFLKVTFNDFPGPIPQNQGPKTVKKNKVKNFKALENLQKTIKHRNTFTFSAQLTCHNVRHSTSIGRAGSDRMGEKKHQPRLFMSTIKALIFLLFILAVYLKFVVCLVVPQEYGGYVTSLLVSGEESPVKCGAVLSPITDFELYGKPCLCCTPCCIW